MPPTLGLALLWSGAAMVVACAAALLLLMRLRGVPLTHAGLVGGMLGPLLIVATLAPALARIEGAWGWLAAALGAGVLLALIGQGGGGLAKRLEGRRPSSAGLTWAGAALLLAGLARSLYGGAGSAWPAHASIPIGVGVGVVGLLGRAPGARRAPRRHFGGLLLLAVAAVAAPFWPSWLPWLLYDRNLPEVAPWPPNFLFVALQAHSAPQKTGLDPVSASLELLGVDGVTYPNLSPEPEVPSLLALPDRSLLGFQLHGVGYVTAAIATVPENARELGFAVVDDRPGGRRLLERSVAWMAGAELLLGPASSVLRLLGHDRPFRSAEQVGAEAARWILGWRTLRAPAPFFLLVDLRAPGAATEALDAGLRRILDRLEGLELNSVTLLLVAVESPPSAAGAPSLRALVIPPSSWPNAPRLEAATQVWGRALSQSLLEIALSDGESPVRLAGFAQEFSLPKPR